MVEREVLFWIYRDVFEKESRQCEMKSETKSEMKTEMKSETKSEMKTEMKRKVKCRKM